MKPIKTTIYQDESVDSGIDILGMFCCSEKSNNEISAIPAIPANRMNSNDKGILKLNIKQENTENSNCSGHNSKNTGNGQNLKKAINEIEIIEISDDDDDDDGIASSKNEIKTFDKNEEIQTENEDPFDLFQDMNFKLTKYTLNKPVILMIRDILQIQQTVPSSKEFSFRGCIFRKVMFYGYAIFNKITKNNKRMYKVDDGTGTVMVLINNKRESYTSKYFSFVLVINIVHG